MPYPESDFIFAVVGEDLGLIGCLGILALFAAFIFFGLRIAIRCRDRFGSLLAGSAIVETVFSIKGVGRFVVDSVSKRDYPAVQGCVLVLAVTFVVINTLVDLMYAFVDPRIKCE